MLQYIRSFFSKNKKNILFIGLFLTFFFFSYSSGYANENPSGISDEDASTIIKGLNGLLQLLSAFLGLVTALITVFIFPGWTSGTLFGLDVYMKEIWILISNVVYFIFAFILITIAFMNIIGKGEGSWELKQAMPKFIVGVLIVPFSWFLVQLILSISAVLTVGVLTLPFDSFADKDFYEGLNDDAKICTKVEVFLGKPDDYSGGGTDTELGESIKCHEHKSIKDFFNGTEDEPGMKSSIFGVISIYTYAVLGLEGMDSIVKGDIESLGQLLDLGFKVIFDIIFVLVYAILMVALFLALFTRGVWLWVYTMLSPLFGLLYFLGDSGKNIIENDKFSISQFIHLALIPVYVSAALAFGLVFLFVASDGLNQGKGGFNEDGSFDAGGINFLITGTHSDVNAEGSLFAGTGSALGKLVVQIFGIAILWIAVISALQKSNVTKTITQPIADFGTSVGKLAAAAPTYAPILPSSMGGSVAGFSQMGKSVTSGIEQAAIGEGSKRGAEFLKTIGVNQGGTETTAKARQAMSELSNTNANTASVITKMRDAVESAGSLEAISRNPELVKLLKEYIEKSNMPNKPDVTSSQTSVAEALGAIDEYARKRSLGDFITGEDLTRLSGKHKVSQALEGKAGSNPEPTSGADSTLNIKIDSTTTKKLDTSSITIDSSTGVATLNSDWDFLKGNSTIGDAEIRAELEKEFDADKVKAIMAAVRAKRSET